MSQVSKRHVEMNAFWHVTVEKYQAGVSTIKTRQFPHCRKLLASVENTEMLLSVRMD